MQNHKSHIDRKRLNELVQVREKNLRDLRPFDLDHLGVIRGVNIINDSSATTMDKVAESLLSFDEQVVWIAEANSEHLAFEILDEVVTEKVKAIVAVGESADIVLSKLWAASKLYVKASSWDEALEACLEIAEANDNVLFSPGSKAHEPFENFKERGAYFNRLVEIKRNAED